jgi:hypothetical protein
MQYLAEETQTVDEGTWSPVLRAVARAEREQEVAALRREVHLTAGSATWETFWKTRLCKVEKV